MPIDPTVTPVIDRGARRAAERAVGAYLAGFQCDNTRTGYRQDLHAWLRFLDELGVDDPIREVSRSHFEIWMRQMEQHGYATATVARRVGTAVRWYEWLCDEDYLDRNPGRRQLADFLDAAEDLGGYDAATCLILGINGLRVGELCGATVEGYEQIEYHHVLHIVGKGNKPAVVPLPTRTVFALEKALDGRASGPLILTQWGTAANRASVARTILRVCRHAGIDVKLPPHGCRHSAITAALDCNVPLRDVQHFARHSDPRTTSRYDRARDNLNRNAAYTLSQALAG